MPFAFFFKKSSYQLLLQKTVYKDLIFYAELIYEASQL